MRARSIRPRAAALAAVLSAALAVVSCSRVPSGGQPILLTDPRADEWLRRQGLGEGDLGRARRLVTDAPPEEALSPLLAPGPFRSRAPTVVLALTRGPDMPSLAARYPAAAFVLLEGFAAATPGGAVPPAAGEPGAAGSAAGPANVRVVRFDRIEAFLRAGRAVGRLLSASSEGEAASRPLAAVLMQSPSARDREEAAAFARGLVETAPAARLLSREVSGPDDREGMRRYLDELDGMGADIYLLKCYTLDGFCLENLAQKGDSAVVEDWAASGYGAGSVLLSVERDLFRAWELALEWGRSRGGEGPLQGPVRVVPGGALERMGAERAAAAAGELGEAR